jgi:hypothetical protein
MSPFYPRYLLLAWLPLITAANPISASSGSLVISSGTISGHGNIISDSCSGSLTVVGTNTYTNSFLPVNELDINTSFLGAGIMTISPTKWQSIEVSSTSGCYFDGEGIDFMRNIYFKNNSETFSQQDQITKDLRVDRSSTLHLNFDEKKLLSSVVSIQGPSVCFLYDEKNTINKVIDESGAILFDNSTSSLEEDGNVYPNADLQELPQESQISQIQLVLKEIQLGVVHEISYFRNLENVCRLEYRKIKDFSERHSSTVLQDQKPLVHNYPTNLEYFYDQ